MEEKHAEAERRRMFYRRNGRRPRTASQPAQEAKNVAAAIQPLLDDEAAATRLQTAWRTQQRRKTVEAFANLGLSIDRVHDTSFEDVGALLSEDRVLKATAKLLSLFGLMDKEEAANAKESTTTRTFLSAYLILGHPTAVLSKDGDQEQDLITKAKDLMISFENALSKVTAFNRYTPPPTQVETVSFAHTAFVTAFGDWKARDSSALIETMVASFVNLDAIWQTVKDDTRGEVASDYREGIRDNQVILLSRIRKLAGPERANMLIKKAIRESRRSRPKRRPVGDVRPRLAEDTSTNNSNAEASTSNVDTASQITHSEHEPQGEGFQSNSLTRLFSVVPPNRVLVHELAIDKDYRVDVSPHSDLRNAINRSVCDSMRRGFENGEGDSWTVAMAENIRAKLLKLLKPGNSMHSLISEVLDPSHVQTQCAQGVFSYEKFFAFMASILPKLCAPFRDEQVNALVEEMEKPGDLAEMIEKLFKLLHVIDLLSLDYSNFLLMNAAPTLIKESGGYEQRMFAQDLESKSITLQRTTRWWRNATVNILTEADRRDPLYRSGTTLQKIYARGLVDLAIASMPLHDSELPETLELDRARITRIRADAVKITVIGAILLTAKNLLKRDVRSQWKPQANRIWELLKDGYGASTSNNNNNGEDSPRPTTPNIPARVLATIETSHAMPASTRATLDSTIGRLLSQAAVGRLADPVMKVLFTRLKTHVFSRLSAISSGERVRAASTATEGLASAGLPEFIAQVGDMVDVLTRISDVDRKAHGTWYEQISEELERAGDEADVDQVMR
ncbi:T-complex protein 11-domain-containing protein [Lineolata rhizophorae]|uniref:T-complex protein 11-domain-containing protein n=1 Tax=Lineolata rhizophorae TaxID=578093 RepID=A0A6A6PC54_9PEZI|nr:T-complex protein 11-domain-containing protein [Lineolata rhizophorae]